MSAPACSPAAFFWRVVTSHTGTYLLAGLLAASLFDYEAQWAVLVEQYGYRPMDAPWVAAGAGLQVIRGLVLALVLWPFRDRILEARGWLPLWGLLVGIGVLSTYAPASGSIEGLIYTTWPVRLGGLLEVGGQALAFSLCLVRWSRRPHRAYGLVLGGLTVLAVGLGLAAPALTQLAASLEATG